MDEGVVETMTWVWRGVMGGPVEVALLSTSRRDAKSGVVVALAASEPGSEGVGSLDEKHGRFHV
jgi:hypothetical protein